jgi:AP-2 complex subunit alpha
MGPQLLNWFKALTVAPQGVLFENALLRVGIVHEYRTSQGRVVLYYYNLSGAPMTGFTVELPDVPHLRTQVLTEPHCYLVLTLMLLLE